MIVYEVIFEYSPRDSKEILTEHNYWTAPSFLHACRVAERHAEEYDKELKSVRNVLTVTRQVLDGE